MLSELPSLRAPSVLDRLVSEEIAGHPGTTARRFAGDLERLKAPQQLQEQLEASLRESDPQASGPSNSGASNSGPSILHAHLEVGAAATSGSLDPDGSERAGRRATAFQAGRAAPRASSQRWRRGRVWALVVGVAVAAGWIGSLLYPFLATKSAPRFEVVERDDLAALREQSPMGFRLADGLSGGALRAQLEQADAAAGALNPRAPVSSVPSNGRQPAPPGTTPSTITTPSTVSPGPSGSAGAASGAPTVRPISLVQLIEKAKLAQATTAHVGQRSVHLYVNSFNTGVHHLVTNERVATDGQGGYSIVAQSAQGDLGLSEDEFLALQAENAAFYYRYRDFVVRDFDLFLKNYLVLGTPKLVSVAGRPCSEITIQRKVPASSGGSTSVLGGLFTVDLDLQSAFVLGYEERTASGILVASMRYDSISYAPDLTGLSFSSIPPVVEIDLAGNPAAQLGFVPYQPKQVPGGYEQQIARVLSEGPNLHWACFEYSDGVENLFFLHGGASPMALIGPQGWTPQVFQSESPYRVYVTSAGCWTVVHGVWQGQYVLAVGKLPREEMLQLVESALPAPK
jgi:hypothetical protein